MLEKESTMYAEREDCMSASLLTVPLQDARPVPSPTLAAVVVPEAGQRRCGRKRLLGAAAVTAVSTLRWIRWLVARAADALCFSERGPNLALSHKGPQRDLPGNKLGGQDGDQQAGSGFRDEDARFKALANLIPGVVYERVVTPDGKIYYTYISEGARDLFGLAPEDIIADPEILFDCFAPEYRATFREHLLKASRELTMWDVEATIIACDGQRKFTRAVARPRHEPDGSVIWDGMILDNTRVKNAENMARRLGRILDDSSNEIYVFSTETLSLCQTNRAACVNLGYSVQELLTMSLPDLQPDLGAEALRKLISPLITKEQRETRVETLHKRKDGTSYPIEMCLYYSDTDGASECIAIVQDITERKKAEEQVRQQASFDPLTGIPNRRLFFERLSEAIVGARRNRNLVAVLFIDLYRFKPINDSLGHAVGDSLLQGVAARLSSCVRENDTVARFGGDEFAIILKDISKADGAAVVAQKVIASVARPFLVDNHELSVGTSVGIAVYPKDADDESGLLRRADFAMFRAKGEGRDAFRFYSSEMNERASFQMSLESDLRNAIERDELVVHYQPIIDVRQLKVTGCEALVRWQHPSRGLVLPGEFISLAEETGLIEPLGEIVLKKACSQARAWHTAGLSAMLMSINVSSYQIKKGLTAKVVDRILNETGAASLPLAFEITESRTLSESREATLWLHAVKELGIRLAIDDFGTGCSSLSYLKRFPIDIVKIDKSFTHDLTCSPNYAALVAGIIALARSMDIQVIAEGVEDSEQMAFLRLLRCDYVQGFHFARALQSRQFEQFARRSRLGGRAAGREVSTV